MCNLNTGLSYTFLDLMLQKEDQLVLFIVLESCDVNENETDSKANGRKLDWKLYSHDMQ